MNETEGGRITGVYKVGDDERQLPASLSGELYESDQPDTFNDAQGNPGLVMSDDFIHAPGDTFRDGRRAAIMAQQRGWQEMNLQGSVEFRRGAYIEAEGRELDTTGYSYTKEDNAARAARNEEYLADESIGLESEVPQIKEAEAPRKEADASLAQGDTDVQEGDQDLASGVEGHAALQSTPGNENQAQPGRAAGDTPAGAIERSEAVRSMTPQELVEAYPDMRQEAGVIAAADAFASEKISSADDQARFTSAIREQVAERVAEGEQLADINIKEERAIERSAEVTQEYDQER